MIEIAMTACSLVQGQQCREFSLVYEAERVSLHTCMLYGQMEMAKWTLDHPNWRITRWRCQPAGQTARL